MVLDKVGPQESADILFYEVQSPDGFLALLESSREFDVEHWQRLWDAVASLLSQQNGKLDIWSTFDLNRVIEAIQAHGLRLVGRPYDGLDDFEKAVLEANMFINNIFASDT